jgi:hypothetical protein
VFNWVFDLTYGASELVFNSLKSCGTGRVGLFYQTFYRLHRAGTATRRTP